MHRSALLLGLAGVARAQFAAPPPPLPQSCPSFREFITFSDIVTTVCCDSDGPGGVVCLPGDIPSQCTAVRPPAPRPRSPRPPCPRPHVR